MATASTSEQLAQQTEEKPWRWLFGLAHRLGLDIYGEENLTRAARADMCAAALILTSIFLFDLATWWLLAYFISSRGSLEEFDLGRASLSVFFAGLLALALLLYERGIMISDTETLGWKRLAVPTAARLLIIAGAAYATAQPVEIVTFWQPIQERAFEEQLREDLASRYKKLDEIRHRQGEPGGGAVEVTAVNKEIDRVERKVIAMNAQRRDLASQVSVQQGAVDHAQQELNRAQVAAENAKTQAEDSKNQTVETQSTLAERRVAEAQRKLANQRAQLARKRADLRQIESDLQIEEQKEGDEKKKEVAAQQHLNADIEMDQLRGLTRRLRNRDADLPLRDYTFLEKLRVIDDYRYGRPPRWPGASDKIELKTESGNLESMRSFLQRELGFADPPQADRSADMWNANRTYYGVFLVASVIPLMSLLFKISMPLPLRLYYSSKWQGTLGHAEAMDIESGRQGKKPPSS